MSTENLTPQTLAEQDYQVTLDEALELAKGHHQSGNFVLAERTYRDILRSVPKHFPTTQFLGALLFQCGYFDESKNYFGQALDVEPDDIGCLNNFAGILLQLGELENALIYLDRSIEIDPKFIDALSNKAYALWNLERFEEAETVALALLEVDPNNVNALNSLGIALSKQIRYEESFDAWEKAVEVDPQNAMCLSNWGNALRDMGRIAEGHVKCKEAYDIDSDDPIVLNNYGNVLRDKGELKEAIEVYKKVTGIKPNYAEAHANLSVAYYDDGQFSDSVVSARYAIAFNVGLSEAYSALSAAEYSLGNLPEAHMAAQTAVKYAKEDVADPYIVLAQVLEGLDQYDDAEASITEALRRQPESARAYIKLCEIRQYMNKFEDAHQAIDRALELSPKMPKALLTKGTTLYQQQRPEDALVFIERAIELSPKWIAPLIQKAELLGAVGDFEKAEAVIHEILEFNDDLPAAYNVLAGFRNFKTPDDELFKKMLEFEDKISTHGVQVENSYYMALAVAYEAFKDYDRAFECLEKGNAAKRKQVSGERSLEKQVKAIETRREIYSPEIIEAGKKHGHESDAPIFILGMPRSGTTLTEQIISSHPDVSPGGELTFVSHVCANVTGSLENLTGAGEEYLRLAREFIGGEQTKHFTDKMPGNSMLIGHIAMMLPNAKIIYCNRNAIDNCLSCFQQNFFMGHYWSYDLEECAQYYLNHEAMIDYWRDLLPGRFLEINYEDTVGDLETQARKLIDYVGLEWDDACLEPHKLKRAVMTASRAQVTKPVYKTSVEKWRRYEKHVQPLVRMLSPELALPQDDTAE